MLCKVVKNFHYFGEKVQKLDSQKKKICAWK